jgi:hypothetical protein
MIYGGVPIRSRSVVSQLSCATCVGGCAISAAVVS